MSRVQLCSVIAVRLTPRGTRLHPVRETNARVTANHNPRLKRTIASLTKKNTLANNSLVLFDTGRALPGVSKGIFFVSGI